MKSKKGVEMSLQTMVIAALSIIILLILVVLFTRQTGIFGQTVNSCDDRGYECRSSCGQDEHPAGKCADGQTCCAPESVLNDQLGLG